MSSRRTFLQSAAAFAAALPGARSQTREARIEVLLGEPVGRIAPEIYGHFVEHLGGVVYDGIWVGENSKIANIGGLRKQLVEALAKTKPAVIRWPGGCFADQYDWRDGIDPDVWPHSLLRRRRGAEHAVVRPMFFRRTCVSGRRCLYRSPQPTDPQLTWASC